MGRVNTASCSGSNSTHPVAGAFLIGAGVEAGELAVRPGPRGIRLAVEITTERHELVRLRAAASSRLLANAGGAGSKPC
eukprot:SAG22_NODE_5153_length_1076_cov_1.012282_2_plen_79_part_00